MALIKLPKRFHPDFRNPLVKPRGPVIIDPKYNPAAVWMGNSFSDKDLISGQGMSLFGTVSELAIGTNNSGTAYRTDVAGSAGGNANVRILTDVNTVLPNQECTIFVVTTPLDTTNRMSQLFGIDSTGLPGHSIGAHVPNSSGNIHWEFGNGETAGNFIDWTGYTKTPGRVDVFGFRAGPSGMQIWNNGILRANTATVPTRTISGTLGYLLFDGAFKNFFGGDVVDINFLSMFAHEMSDAELQHLSANPYDVLAPANPLSYFPTDAVGGVTVSPGNATLTYTGQAPTILTPTTVTPGNDTLTYTGQAPTILTSIVVAPANDTLNYNGQTPVILTPVVVSPANDTLNYNGQVPVILTPVTVSPGNDTLNYNGQAPTILADVTVAPGAGTLTYSGLVPTVVSSSDVAPDDDFPITRLHEHR